MGRPSKRIGGGRIGRANKKIGRYLGEEIIEEILSRLPVKSLLRFQLVSKSWASLIGRSERFINTHLKNSRENADLGNHRIIYDYLPGIVSSRKGEISEFQYSVHSLMNDPVPASDPSGLEHPTDFRIVGCCNGLVCIRNPLHRSFYLWNPSTRICIELPKLETKGFINRTGFGWDESSGAYKVFVFLCVLAAAGMDRCVVYSSKTNKWEKVETNFDWGTFCAKEDGVLVNGKFHWHGYGGMVVVIVSLDLRSTECAVIGTLDQPCDGRDLFRQRLSLGVVGGCLSVAHHGGKLGEKLDVWVMKEYGVKKSWYRAMSVRLDHLIGPYYQPNSYIKKKDRSCICVMQNILGHCICMPLNATAIVLGQGPEGEILISYESFFLAYHSKKKDAVVSRLKEIKDGARARAHLYLESLVSPERIILGQS